MIQKVSKFGAVAAGHDETAQAAADVLCAGGNAFDAAIAAMTTACVVEPVLASLGGGGFLLARHAKNLNDVIVYDFFAQTPRVKLTAEEIEFFPILANFGTATQEFYIGAGACATPGMVSGIDAIQRDLCRMPSVDHFHHAVRLAREGVRINDFQSFLFQVVAAIYVRDAACREYFADEEGNLAPAGSIIRNLDLGDTLVALASEGADLFSTGEIAMQIAEFSKSNGGHLRLDDLQNYRVERRKSLSFPYHDSRIYTNSPPSTGGLMIAFSLRLMEKLKYGLALADDYQTLSRIMEETNRTRIESALNELSENPETTSLDIRFLKIYQTEVLGKPFVTRGTTHISVIDASGNVASTTLSNGEGCGRVLPGLGYMMNNMLGEEDINPLGLNAWAKNSRLSSMMSPSLILEKDQKVTALGSGGSNRIRTAVLQVISNILDKRMNVQAAVCEPRLHREGDTIHIEGPRSHDVIQNLSKLAPKSLYWDSPNLFFGGTHVVQNDPNTCEFSAFGDPRRGGCAIVI